MARSGLRRVLGVAALTSRWIVRQPLWMVQDAVSVAAFLIILYAWGGVDAARNVVVAWFVGGMWSLGVNMVGQEVGWHRVHGMHQLYIASPLKPREYLAGVLLGNTVFLPSSLAVLSLLALLLGAQSLVPASIAASLLLLPTSVMVGVTLAMSVRKPTNVSAVTNPVSMLLILLPPVFYPAQALPKTLRPLALVAPTSAAAELARSLAGFYATYPPAYPLASLAAWAAAGFLLASHTIRWGHE